MARLTWYQISTRYCRFWRILSGFNYKKEVNEYMDICLIKLLTQQNLLATTVSAFSSLKSPSFCAKPRMALNGNKLLLRQVICSFLGIRWNGYSFVEFDIDLLNIQWYWIVECDIDLLNVILICWMWYWFVEKKATGSIK